MERVVVLGVLFAGGFRDGVGERIPRRLIGFHVGNGRHRRPCVPFGLGEKRPAGFQVR